MGKWKMFWSYAGERALKTFAQTALATIGVGVTGLLAVDWLNVVSVSGLACVMSLLTSVTQYDKESD